ncbi:MAG: DUF4440 domain-containing protein [Cyclobacteriaceae bacterium]
MKVKLLPLLTLLTACSTTPKQIDVESLKAEIMQAEKAFNDMAAEQGVAAAFAAFAAEDGVIKRGGKLIMGNKSIAEWYLENSSPEEKLTWKPDFVDVSSSGDLAYTYGGFEFSYPDSTGTMQTSTGYFHSVWKRQADGSWKFVWD